ncbi:MAG: glycoside hydrolase family 3 protein [Bryobacteraceae bacterium]|nr:glycoside hydrolase family 3 protein [Bryobacteraceae bacterium]
MLKLLPLLAVCLTVAAVPPKAKLPAKKPPMPVGKAKPAPKPLAPPAHAPAEVQRWMRSMTLRDQIAQLVIIPCFGEAHSSQSADFRRYVQLVQDTGVGGMIVINRVVNGQVRNAEPHAMAAFLNRMQKVAKVPLIVGGDFERGASMRVANTTKFPHAMAYGAANDLKATRMEGYATAREARALGVHWIFAPSADVNNNPDNPIINTRSFGERPEAVAAHVKAFIEGAHSDPQAPVLVTVKHFPGHGDTATDTHMALAVVTAGRARLDALEFVPFQAAIQAGVDSVMTSHLSVPAIEPAEIPATVSKNVLTNVLRRDLGFRGLVVTDAMDMQGLTKQFSAGEAAVRALEAGADVLLMSPRPEQAIQAVLLAIQSGRLSEDQIRESVAKLLAAKVRLGLHKQRLVDVEMVSEQVDSPVFAESAQSVADRAVTLLRNPANLVPLREPAQACLVALAEGRYSTQGRRLIEEAQLRTPTMKTHWIDSALPKADLAELAADLTKSCATIVLGAFVNTAAYRGNVGLAGNFPDFVETLAKSNVPLILVSLGSPYFVRGFPNAQAILATCSGAPTAELAAVRALWGEIDITGKLPVTIPGFSAVGDGLPLARRTAVVHGQTGQQE